MAVIKSQFSHSLANSRTFNSREYFYEISQKWSFETEETAAAHNNLSRDNSMPTNYSGPNFGASREQRRVPLRLIFLSGIVKLIYLLSTSMKPHGLSCLLGTTLVKL